MRQLGQSAVEHVAARPHVATSARAHVRFVAPVLGIAGVLGCTDLDGLPARASHESRLPFAEFEFVDVGQVVLRQNESSSLVSVDNLDIRDDGLLLITDRDQPAVLLFDSSGSPIPMSSPAAIRDAPPYASPYDAIFLDRDRIAVSDFPPRIVVLNMADHSVDFSFPLDQEIWSPQLHAHDSVFIVEKTDTHAPGAAFFEYSFDGSIVRAFHHHVQHVLELPPYWGSAGYHHHLAIAPNHFYVASSMLYPMHRYNASTLSVTEFGTAPSSFRHPRRPRAGEFIGAERAFQLFLRSFTKIRSLWVVADNFLIVEHRDLDPSEFGYQKASYRADIYALSSLTKVSQDVPLPGKILFARDHLVVLSNAPPTGAWTLSSLAIREKKGGSP